MSPWKQMLVLAVLAGAGFGVWQFVTDDGKNADAAVRQAPPEIPVVVEPVRTGVASETVDAIGTSRANEAVALTTEIQGTIESIDFANGETVAAGEVIVTLDADEAEADLASAEAALYNARRLVERALTLLGSSSISQAQVDELQAGLAAAEADVAAATARLADTRVAAPFGGTLGIRQVSLGALVSPGDLIVTLDDLSLIKVDFAIPETLLSQIAPGLPVRVTSDAFPDRVFEGEIQTIATRVDPVNRTIAAVAVLENSDGVLRPGMFLTVRVTLDVRPDALLVSEEALVPQGERQFVYVVSDGKAERREVAIGARYDGDVEIAAGLEEGSMVVIRGIQRLRDGAPVSAEIEPPLSPVADS